MLIEPKSLTWILMLLFLYDVLCDTWKVEYQHQRICAVKGSSMVILCSFYPPNNLTVKQISWARMNSNCYVTGNLRKVASRFQYIGDRLSNCSTRIHQVERNDEGRYRVVFFKKNQRVCPRNKSIFLKVIDLEIFVTKFSGSRETLEGDSVNLTCLNSCDDRNSSSDFTWFKNGLLLNEGPVLYLRSMSFNHSGNYTCSLKTQPGTTSGAVNINVEYGPKNTSVSLTLLREDYTGMNFTLICSSDANPPVEKYTWFKKDKDNDTAVGRHSVLFTDEAGQYFCSAASKHGSQNSSVVTVGVKSNWMTYTREVVIISTVVLLLIVVAVIAIKRCHKKRTWQPTTIYIEETEVQDTDYVNWLPCDIIQSQQDNQHEEGTELVYATIDFSNYNNNC